MRKNKIDAYSLLARVRRQSPVVHHLTNWVTIYDCAAIVKALGASPVMAHAPEEAAEMAGIASSLVLNIGTLTTDLVEAMKIAAASANKKGIPVVLDVCGAGATALRDRKSLELLRRPGDPLPPDIGGRSSDRVKRASELDTVRIDILKGNASEVARIAGGDIRTKGVDSAQVEGDLIRLAAELSLRRKLTVVITGKEDVVSDGQRTYLVKNGHPLMSCVVGTGCMAASVIGAFAAVEKDLPFAAAAGLSCFEIAAEIAAKGSPGPAFFKQRMLDALFKLDKNSVTRMQKISLA